jgi:hypothetical protein
METGRPAPCRFLFYYGRKMKRLLQNVLNREEKMNKLFKIKGFLMFIACAAFTPVYAVNANGFTDLESEINSAQTSITFSRTGLACLNSLPVNANNSYKLSALVNSGIIFRNDKNFINGTIAADRPNRNADNSNAIFSVDSNTPWNDFAAQYKRNDISGQTIYLAEDIKAAAGDDNAFGNSASSGFTIAGHDGKMYVIDAGGMIDKGF